MNAQLIEDLWSTKMSSPDRINSRFFKVIEEDPEIPLVPKNLCLMLWKPMAHEAQVEAHDALVLRHHAHGLEGRHREPALPRGADPAEQADRPGVHR